MGRRTGLLLVQIFFEAKFKVNQKLPKKVSRSLALLELNCTETESLVLELSQPLVMTPPVLLKFTKFMCLDIFLFSGLLENF